MMQGVIEALDQPAAPAAFATFEGVNVLPGVTHGLAQFLQGQAQPHPLRLHLTANDGVIEFFSRASALATWLIGFHCCCFSIVSNC